MSGDVPTATRSQIVALKQHTSKSNREIARDLSLSHTTVNSIVRKWQLSGSVNASRIGKCGRKGALSNRSISFIARACKRDPSMTARELQEDCGVEAEHVSIWTIRRALKSKSIRAYRPVPVPLLNAKKRQTRLAWAKLHLNWTNEDWNQVIFTDETMVQIDSMKYRHVYKVKGERRRDAHCFPRKAYPIKIMFWGAISHFGPGPLLPIQGSMNSAKYTQILEKDLLEFAVYCYGDSPWKLLQDGAPCHVSRVTNQCLQDNGIDTVPWPSNSCDLNAIENVWSTLKKKLYRSGSGSTRSEVIEKAQYIWANDPDIHNMCVKCVASMPSRVREVVRNKGGVTSY